MKSEAKIAHDGTSELAKAIREAVKSQPWFEPEAYDACQPKNISKCTLARGIEKSVCSRDHSAHFSQDFKEPGAMDIRRMFLHAYPEVDYNTIQEGNRTRIQLPT